MLDHLRLIGELLDIIASLYLPEPPREALEKLLSLERTGDPELDVALEEFRTMSKRVGGIEALYDMVLDEYVVLFYAKKPVPPYESSHVDEIKLGGMVFRGLMMGPSTLKVAEAYRRAGLELSKEFKEPPDHIGVELAFLAHLALQAALSKGEDRRRLINLQREFLEEHVMRWVPRFCSMLKTCKEAKVYRIIARITERVLRLYHELLNRSSLHQFSNT